MNSFEKTIAATVAATGISTVGITGMPVQKAEAQLHHRQIPVTQEHLSTRQQVIDAQNRRTQENMIMHNRAADQIRLQREKYYRQQPPQNINQSYPHPINRVKVIFKNGRRCNVH